MNIHELFIKVHEHLSLSVVHELQFMIWPVHEPFESSWNDPLIMNHWTVHEHSSFLWNIRQFMNWSSTVTYGSWTFQNSFAVHNATVTLLNAIFWETLKIKQTCIFWGFTGLSSTHLETWTQTGPKMDTNRYNSVSPPTWIHIQINCPCRLSISMFLQNISPIGLFISVLGLTERFFE